tara:strand:- start:11225 stop:11443 length:219 start_codon:yes stop_codon:yes gene_type:complete
MFLQPDGGAGTNCPIVIMINMTRISRFEKLFGSGAVCLRIIILIRNRPFLRATAIRRGRIKIPPATCIRASV